MRCSQGTWFGTLFKHVCFRKILVISDYEGSKCSSSASFLSRELLITPAQLYLLWTPSLSYSLSSLVRNADDAGCWGRVKRGFPWKFTSQMSRPLRTLSFSETLPALWPWSVTWKGRVWGLDSIPVLEWPTPPPGQQMASRNKKKSLHFQSHLKCPSQPANYAQRFLKETLV